MNMPKLQPLWPTILWEFLVIIVTKHVFVFVVFPWKIFIFYDLLAVVNLMDNSLLSCADNSCKKQVICQRWNMYMLLTFALLIYFGAVLDCPCPCNFHQPKKKGKESENCRCSHILFVMTTHDATPVKMVGAQQSSQPWVVKFLVV